MKMLVISHACVRAINREIYRMLRDRGIDVEILIPLSIMKGQTRIEAEPDDLRDPTIIRRLMTGANGRLFRYENLNGLLDARKPDFVLVESDPASYLAVAAGRWCRRNGARLACLTNENLSWRLLDAVRRCGVSEVPASVAKMLLIALSRSTIDHVFTTSEQAAAVFRRNGFTSVSVMPLGTNRKTFQYSSRLRRRVRADLGIATEERVVAYFGRMVPEKGVETLIEAMSFLQDSSWRLLLNRFESNSAYSDEIRRLIDERRIKSRVIWAPSRHGEIAAIMNATDVVVLPSRTTPKWVEQFGRVIPEAMACGNLVVVSDSGAPKELCLPHGFVFPEGDAVTLAGILRSIVAAPAECGVRRRRSIRHAHRHFSLQTQADKFEKVIHSLKKP